MKTPMQELIERLDKEINSKYPDGYNIVMEIAKDLTEQMLEKEKEAIIRAHMNVSDDKDHALQDVHLREFAERYYNETFNTKEK